MKIANNKLSSLLHYYNNELSYRYDKYELYAIFELVCEHYLKLNKQEVKLQLGNNINQSDVINIYNTCNELKTGKPIQYILKQGYFYDLPFNVDEQVLIPRPETEELVHLVINTIQKNNITIIDLGTGSGCIPITLKYHLKEATVYGIDISLDALAVAKQNAINNNVDVTFVNLDILTTTHLPLPKFDVIVSNPPYIAQHEKAEMTKSVLDFEPSLALFVTDEDPIIFYKKIIDLSLMSLHKNGYLFLELNPLYALDVLEYALNTTIFNSCNLVKDMSGKHRFLTIQL